MSWSAEIAMLEFWAEHDQTKTNGEVQRHLERHLQLAYEAGKRETDKIWRDGCAMDGICYLNAELDQR